MSEGIGWLPVEARAQLEEHHDAKSGEEAERLLALAPAARAMALLDRAATRAPDAEALAPLRPFDLRRVLASFGGEVPDEAELERRYGVLLGSVV
jgi:hypothetical protein